MNQKLQKTNFTIFLMIIVLIQPIITQLTAISSRNIISIPSIGLIYNTLLIIFSVLYVLFLSKSKYRKISIYYLSILFIYCLLFFILKFLSGPMSDIIYECKVFIKYLYFPIVTLGFLNCINSKNSNMLINTLKIALFIYNCLIILALVSGTAFPAYDNSYIGKIGWFYSTNEISAMMCVLLPIVFVNFKKDLFNILLIITSLISVLSIGTKTSFLGLGLILLILVIYLFKKEKKKNKLITLSIVIVLIVACVVFKPPTVINFKKSIDNYISNKNNKLLNQSDYGSVNFLILSERTCFFKSALNEYKGIVISQQILGSGFVINGETRHLVEMDFFDLIFRYGVLGLICLCIHLLYTVYKIIKYFQSKKRKDFSSLLLIYSFIISLIISFLTGHVFGAPAVSFFIAIIIAIIINNIDKGDKNYE